MARPLRPLVAVALGGAVGSLARWALVGLSPSAADDATVAGINVAGSFLLGWLLGRRERMDPDRLLAIGTGFAGGLTTFSSYAVTVATDLDQGALLAAAGNGLGTPVAALLAAGLGFRSSRLLGARRRRSARRASERTSGRPGGRG